ncbi:MAG: Rv3654c family TadE-like protein [Micromonosporaceae bacterium]
MRDGERGSASIWVLAVGLAVVAVGLFGASYGAAVVARHRAQAAADLGALSAAVHAVEGEAAACRHAERTVTANRARMASCRVEGLEAVVTAEVVAAGPAASLGPAQGRARAGPAWAA